MKLLGPGRVITRDSEGSFYENGGVVYEGACITAVGDYDTLKATYPNAELIDAKGGVIMPALINTHEHIYSSFARGLSLTNYNPKNFDDILSGMWWRLDSHLTVEDTKWCGYAAYLDCIKNGVTTVFDHHASYKEITGSLFALADVSKELGLRSCLCFEVSDRNGEEAMRLGVAENEAFIDYAKDEPRLSAMMGLHAPFTLSDASLDFAMSHAHGCGAHIHVAEGTVDEEDSMKKYGKPIVHRLKEHGVLGAKSFTVHCIHINEDEMDILAETDTVVIHNPESNMGNAVGCQPMQQIFDKGILLGLGTDAYTHDMFESAKVANILHKHQNGDPNQGGETVLTMMYENNAKIAARHFDTQLGMLQQGASADIIVLDYDPVTPMTAGNANYHLLFGVNGTAVQTTICAGKTLMKDRIVLVADEKEIWARCREQAADLWARVNA